MDARHRTGLEALIPGGTFFDSPMDRMTAYGVGGRAEAVCMPRELPMLKGLVSYLHREGIPWSVVGRCSNLLVGDRGIRGAVIVLREGLASIEQEGDAPVIVAGGGLSVADLLSHCRREGLSGLEFMAGIPGTLGGAVFMNAGAWGREIGGLVLDVLAVTRDGHEVVLKACDIRFSYRSSTVPEGSVIYGVRIGLERGDSKEIGAEIARNLKRKKAAQPQGLPNAGSVFRNPPGDYAGRLIEGAGLKGARIGGAMISPGHANFIVNTGGASASDILALIGLARDRVREETGIELETEIKILGEF